MLEAAVGAWAEPLQPSCSRAQRLLHRRSLSLTLSLIVPTLSSTTRRFQAESIATAIRASTARPEDAERASRSPTWIRASMRRMASVPPAASESV
jgi:hypothetical protein